MSGQSLFRLHNCKPPVTASQMHKLRKHCREHLLRPSQLADRVLRSRMEFLEQWNGDVCALQVGRERKCLIARLILRVLASGWKTQIEHFQPQGASAVFPAPHTGTSQCRRRVLRIFASSGHNSPVSCPASVCSVPLMFLGGSGFEFLPHINCFCLAPNTNPRV